MTAAEARAARVCRLCGGPIDVRRADGKGYVGVTYNFGREHAHTACHETAEAERRNAWVFVSATPALKGGA